jgi:large subunit ribosomal protein L29
MQAATGELDNTARLRQAKREVARALTIARERGVDPNVKAEADNG